MQLCSDAQLREAEGEFDGVEGGFDAIIVEVDWNSPAFAGRTKRQSGFSSGSLLLFLLIRLDDAHLLSCRVPEIG